jgi:hypothetical protein
VRTDGKFSINFVLLSVESWSFSFLVVEGVRLSRFVCGLVLCANR